MREIRRQPVPFVQPIGVIAFDDFGEKRPEPIIVCTEHGQTVKRHLVDELEEALVDAFHAAVMIQMFSIEVRDRGNRGRQAQERPVTLVSFGHQEIASTEPGMASERVHLPADDHRRIQPALGQYISHHRCCRRLSMRSSDRDAEFQPHQFRQHLGPRNHRNLLRLCSDDLGFCGETAEETTTT